MSKVGGGTNTVIKIIIWVLVVLLLFGAAGVIVSYVLQNEGVSFYVEYNGERYFSSVSEADLFFETGDIYTFNVKSLTGENIDYSVVVQSNGEHNFSFISNSENYDFYVFDDSENNDYSSVFGLKQNEDSFSIIIPENTTVKKIIEMKYGNEIQLQNDLQEGVSYFVVKVNSGDNSLNLAFRFDVIISINPPSIVF